MKPTTTYLPNCLIALLDASKGDCRKAVLAAKAKENLTESSATESNNKKVTSMVENITLSAMLPCLVCSFTTATNRTITSSEDGTTSTKVSQSRACDNNFTAYKDLKGRGRDLSADGGVLRDGLLRLPPNLCPSLPRRLHNRSYTRSQYFFHDTPIFGEDLALLHR